MDSGVLRDFVISITGGLILVLLILAVIIGLLLYFHIKKLLRTIQATVTTVKAMDKEATSAIKTTGEIFGLFTGKKNTEETAKSK